jgi:hypothetical protein
MLLRGDQIKVTKHDAESHGYGPGILGSVLGFESPGSPAESVNVFVELALSMREHGRVGSLCEGGIDREQLRVEQVVDRTSTVGAGARRRRLRKMSAIDRCLV